MDLLTYLLTRVHLLIRLDVSNNGVDYKDELNGRRFFEHRLCIVFGLTFDDFGDRAETNSSKTQFFKKQITRLSKGWWGYALA